MPDDIMSEFKKLSEKAARDIAIANERARRFSEFHQAILMNIEDWINELSAAEVEIVSKRTKSIATTESRVRFPSFFLDITNKNLHPLHVEATSYNRIDFNDTSQRAILLITTHDGDDHIDRNLTIFPAETRPQPAQSRVSVPQHKTLSWSKDAFHNMLSEWIRAARK